MRASGQVVSEDGGTVAGAMVISVTSELGQLDAMRGPCASCMSANAAVCGCGPAAKLLVDRLDAHHDESAVIARTTTDANGRFDVAVGAKLGGLWVEAPPFATKFTRFYAGQVAPKIILAPGVMTRGQVLDESREPIASAIVTHVSSDGRYFDAVTDDTGTFTLGPFANPLGGVLARRAGYLARWSSLKESEDGGLAEVVLLDPRTLRVSVRDDQGPLKGAPVELINASCAASAVTDENGNAEFTNLSPQELRIRAGGDLVGAHRELTLERGQDVQTMAPLVMRSWAAIEVDLEPTPAHYPSVSLHCGYDVSHLSIPATTKGHYARGQLPARECLLEVEGQKKWVTLELGKTTREKVTLEQPYKVEVKAVDAQGRRVDASIAYARPGQTGSGSGGSPLTLERGTWQVWAREGDTLSDRRTITVPMKGVVTVTVRRAPRVSGTVVESTGVPVMGASVSTKCAEDDLGSARDDTDKRGHFRLTAEQTGRCKLVAYHSREGLNRSVEQPVVLGLDGQSTVTLKFAPVQKTRGTVVDALGAPVTEPLRLQLAGNKAHAQAMAVDGGFEVLLEPGAWKPSVFASGFEMTTTAIKPGDQKARIEVKRPEPVLGRVVDVRGKPVTEFEVNGRRVRDAEGRFFADGREDGIDLYARGAGSAIVGRNVHGDAGTVVLGVERVVAVRVLDEAGNPETRATVVRPWPGPKRVSCHSFATNPVDAQGRGWLELKPSQRALVVAPGYLPFETAGAVDGGVEEIRLQRGPHTLSGVVRRQGKPVRGADLCLSGPTSQLATTQADGTFSFEGLGPGAYEVSAMEKRLTRNGAPSWYTEKTFDVRDGLKAVTIDLERHP